MFRLTKWYMDCIAADGTTVIAYWARLTWGLLRMRCAAVLVRRAGTISEDATLTAGGEPRRERDRVNWKNARLGLQGHWDGIDPPVSRRLLASRSGAVDWHCFLPRARGRIILGDGERVEGLGYVERLDLTLPPWQLPIRELRWGRFLSEDAGVVWIDWRGDHTLTLITLNGHEVEKPQVGDEGSAWSSGHLDLEDGFVLREGALGRNALARVPLLAILAPHAVRETHECKRLRRGTLTDGRDGTGWVIDEVVRFGGPRG